VQSLSQTTSNKRKPSNPIFNWDIHSGAMAEEFNVIIIGAGKPPKSLIADLILIPQVWPV
jgi:hypothetical protein